MLIFSIIYSISHLILNTEFKYDREEEDTPAAWRFLDGINDFGHLKLWKRRFNRQAVITVNPAATGIMTKHNHFNFVRFLNAFSFFIRVHYCQSCYRRARSVQASITSPSRIYRNQTTGCRSSGSYCHHGQFPSKYKN